MAPSKAQAQLIDWIIGDDSAEVVSESKRGLSLRIVAEVNGLTKTDRQVLVEQKDSVQLKAEFLKNGALVSLAEIQKKYSISFTWYKILPSSNVFLDPRALKYFSAESRYQYENFAPFVPKKLKYLAEEHLSEDLGSIPLDEVQEKNELFFERNQQRVGSLRWKVIAHLTDLKSEVSFSISSPSESRLSKPFDQLKTAETSQVFILSRKGDSGYPVYDLAVSYLGLPYIWWTGSPSRMLGLTCSQLVSVAAFKKDLSTSELHAMKGIQISGIKEGRFYARINGKEQALRYGQQVKPGDILVYYSGKEERHAAMIAEDHGNQPGFLDEEDMMIHSTVSGMLGGNFFKKGLEYTQLGSIFNEETLEYKIRIISTGPKKEN